MKISSGIRKQLSVNTQRTKSSRPKVPQAKYRNRPQNAPTLRMNSYYFSWILKQLRVTVTLFAEQHCNDFPLIYAILRYLSTILCPQKWSFKLSCLANALKKKNYLSFIYAAGGYLRVILEWFDLIRNGNGHIWVGALGVSQIKSSLTLRFNMGGEM